MNVITVFAVAFGLAMDAFAVSVCNGVIAKEAKVGYAFKLALFFGLFQAVMPVAGWFIGIEAYRFISEIDHWIAFGLLSLIGAKMIFSSTKMKLDEREKGLIGIYVLLALSVATSIDALVVGFSLPLLDVSIKTVALIIGGVTFSLSFLGVFIGNRLGHFFENKIEAIGGLVLIGIGIKILVEHL
ncbi:MAG: manganese efflux pump [Candidatus Omnitrophota bacterium]|nr:MAG: manganese efflux pump [Candidatus Omnitrophota bacterium]